MRLPKGVSVPFWRFRLTLMFLMVVAAIWLFCAACAKDDRPHERVPLRMIQTTSSYGDVQVLTDTVLGNVCYRYNVGISCLHLEKGR